MFDSFFLFFLSSSSVSLQRKRLLHTNLFILTKRREKEILVLDHQKATRSKKNPLPYSRRNYTSPQGTTCFCFPII